MRRFLLYLTGIIFAFSLKGNAQNSLNMSLLGKYSFPYLEGIVVSGNYAYLLDNNSSPPSILVVDVTDPASLTWANSISLSDNLYYPNHLFYNDSKLFVGALGTYFSVVDINTSDSPKEIAGYDEYCNDARFKEHFMYLAAGTNGLVILDIGSLSNIKEIGSYEPNGNVLGLEVKDTLAFLACDDGAVHVVNIKDNAFPSLISSFNTPGSAFRIEVYDHLAYVADGTKGLRILNVSDLKNIEETGFFESDSITNNVNFTNLKVLGSYVLVLDANFGMRMFDVSDPENPAQVAFFKLQLPKDFYTVGDLIYVPEQSGMFIIKNELLTNIESSAMAIQCYNLFANYPNPFNSETYIRFKIPQKERVKIVLFDVLGRQKSVLLDAVESAGEHRIKFSAKNLPSGIYFYRLQTSHFTATKKLVLIK